MLRVLIGFPFGTRMGGAEALFWSLLRGRRAAGIDPHVLLFEDGPLREEIEAEGIEVTVIEPGRFREPWRLAAAIARATALIRRMKPDLVISWLPRVQTVLAPAALAAGRGDRVVYFEFEIPREWVNHAAVALPCRWVVAVSEASLAANQAMRPHRDGTTVWPGIPTPQHTPPRRLAELRSGLGLGARPVVGIAGRLVSWKGQDKLIRATALLRDQGVDFDLLVVGGETHGVDAGIAAHLRTLTDELAVGDRVRFTGHVSPSTPYIELMDVMVSASDGEPFGIVLLEAMALGVPIVAVDKYGPSEIVEDGVTGLLVPTNEPEELAPAIADLLRDERRAAMLAAGGLERFRSEFGEERMLADIRRTLHGLARELEATR